MSGRSDATLNRGGVRLGAAEIYGVVESMPEISDSLVVGIELPEAGYSLRLFVVRAPGVEVDTGLRERIVRVSRQELSPRHVPDETLTAPGVPRTLTGKKLEIPVKGLLQDAKVDDAVSDGAVERPDLLSWFATSSSPSLTRSDSRQVLTRGGRAVARSRRPRTGVSAKQPPPEGGGCCGGRRANGRRGSRRCRHASPRSWRPVG